MKGLRVKPITQADLDDLKVCVAALSAVSNVGRASSPRNTDGLSMNGSAHIIVPIDAPMLVRLTPKSTRFGDDFVGTLAHWMLARLSPLHFGCCHEPVYSPSYVGATACPLIPSNDRNALNG
jgi:hypothetical protein